MKRSWNQVTQSVEDDGISTNGTNNTDQNKLVHPYEYKSLVTSRTKNQLVLLSNINSSEVFERTKSLIELSKSILLLSAKDHVLIMDLLLERLENEDRSDLKVKVILLLEKLAYLPHINPVLLMGSFINQLSTKSTKIRSQLYKVITNILKTRQVIMDSTTEEQIYHLILNIQQELSESHHSIRSECVNLLSLVPKIFNNYKGPSTINPIEKEKLLSEMEIQSIIRNYVLDPDPRVRKNSLNSLVQMHMNGCSLDQPLYYLAVQSLSDDYEQVRLCALDLVWALCSLYPDFKLNLASEQILEKVRLIDDAFSRVCDLVNDVSVVVRTKACVMLASYHDVELDVLSQTFSKQLMSRLRRMLNGKSKPQNPKKPSGSIPTAAGDIDVDSDEFRILDSGACGAFIHGLEDEYQEVRNAAIDSICELCMYHNELIKKAVECLVDMFNDEIDKVRINAIQSLRKIGTKAILEFNSEELEVAVGAFEDSDHVAREAAHDLMKVVRLKNAEDLEKLLLALMSSVKRYPEDKLSILRCLCDVGKRHDDYIETLLPSLLHLDKRYLAREQSISDFTYTFNVILIINACSNNSHILSQLPKHMLSHFAYYKRKYPECVPDLREIYSDSNLKLSDDIDYLPKQFTSLVPDSLEVGLDKYIDMTLVMVNTIQTQVKHSNFKDSLKTLQVAKRNFDYLSTLKSIHSETSYMAKLYLQCFEIVIKAKQNLGSSEYANRAQKGAASLLQSSYKIQYSFLGIPNNTLQAAMYFRLLANMIWFFGILKLIPLSNSSSSTIRNMLYAFIRRVDVIQKHFDIDFPYTKNVTRLRSNLVRTAEKPTTPNILSLHFFIMDFLPLDVDFTKAVKRTWSIITSPTCNPDKPIKFEPIIPVRLTIEANLSHVLDLNHIGIEIILPNQTSIFYWPTSSQFVSTYSDSYKLTTTIHLSLPNWKEMDTVICRIVRSFEPDLPGLDHFISKSSENSKTLNGLSSIHSLSTVQHFSTIVISDPLTIHLTPTLSSSSSF
ncbi:unnamed protein product [Cunninghamella echinulata]